MGNRMKFSDIETINGMSKTFPLMENQGPPG